MLKFLKNKIDYWKQEYIDCHKSLITQENILTRVFKANEDLIQLNRELWNENHDLLELNKNMLNTIKELRSNYVKD